MNARASGKSVRRNVIWNVVGQVVPLAVALFCIPLTIKGLGNERFGALSIVWTLLVYFGFLDLGLGRSLMQLLAKHEGNDKEEAVLIWTNFAVIGILGAAAGIFLFAATPLVASRLLHLQGPLEVETLRALRLFALGLPLLIHDTALRGVLEAKRRFDLSNRIRIGSGIFTYVAPLLVIPFTQDLAVVVGTMLLGRVAAWGLDFWMVLRVLPHLGSNAGWEPRRIPGFLKSGVWYLVPTAVGPMLNSMDRFFISGLLSISVVAYYVTPYEMVSKLWILSAGISGVAFMEFSARFHKNPVEARILMLRGLRYTLAALFPVVLIVVAYAHEGLSLWLKNPAFADAGAPVLRWLAVFALIGAIGHIVNSFLLGAGRANLIARIQVLELPLHAGLLFILLKADGIRGAAIASVIRITVDLILLLAFAGPMLRFSAKTYAKILVPLVLCLGILFVVGLPLPLLSKTMMVAAVFAGHLVVSWWRVLEQKDRTRLRHLIGRA